MRRSLAASLAVSILFAMIGLAVADSDVETRSSSIRVRVADSGSNAPNGCGDDDAVSGGFVNSDFSRETSKMFLFGFNPTAGGLPGGPSWRTTVANLAEGSTGRGKLTAIAYCDERGARLTTERANVAIKPSAKAAATVRCPGGSEVVSGGFSDKYAGTNGSLVFGYRSKRVGRRGWRASAFNLSDSIASRLIVLVNCDRREPPLSERSEEIEIPAEGEESVRVRCGARREAISAGFGSRVRLPGADGGFPYELMRVSRRAWRASAFADGPAVGFTAYLYCGDTR